MTDLLRPDGRRGRQFKTSGRDRPVRLSRLAQAGCLAEVKGMRMRMEVSLNESLIDTVM